MTKTNVSVVRVLVYTGSRQQVQEQLSQRSVKGSKQFLNMRIDEAVIGDYPLADMSEFLNTKKVSA